MRKIVTYNTLGENMVEIYSSATVWGELRPDLLRAGIPFEGLRAMTNPGQVTLESLQAELPEGEFQLFLMPQKVKSGWDEDDNPIGHGDVDWTNEDPENFDFRTPKDKAIACLKRASYLTNQAVEILANQLSAPKSGNDPIIASLKAQAAEMQRNMDMFN